MLEENRSLPFSPGSVTRLCLNPHNGKYIAIFGCDRVCRWNEAVLLNDFFPRELHVRWWLRKYPLLTKCDPQDV